MSVLKNQKNQKSLFKVNIFIFITQIFFLIIKCNGDGDCSSCIFNTTSGDWIDRSNCADCIYHLEDNTTYLCNGINKTKNYIYNGSACIEMDRCPNKVVKETNECVPRCLGNSYELGDECYLTYDNNTMKCQEYPIKQCQCLNTYYTEKNEVTKEIHYVCQNSSFNCSTYKDYYKDSDKNQCVPDCGSDKLIREDIKRCSYECEANEFKYTEKYADDTEKTFCYEKCPDKAPFYYFNSISNISICHDSCGNEDFNDDYKCVSKCPEGKVHLIDLSDNIKRNCSSEENIINEFPYKYNETGEVYFFKRCDDIKEMNIFNKRTTYYLNEGGINKCVDNCPNYILDGTNNCTNCSEEGECLKGNICFKYNTTNRTDNKYFMIENFDSTQPNECTESCPANYYIDKKNKRCNKYICGNGFINPNNFECMETCNVPINPSSPNHTNGEGYIYKDYINITENLTVAERSFCYPSCFINGTQMHYLYGDNKCFENECKYYQENGNTNPKYSAFNNSYVCYNSCELIGEGYNYQSDYICYSKPILCDEPYYYMEKGLKKCASYNDCKDKYHFKYIIDKECVNDCNISNSLYYSYYDGQNLGECFSDPNECIKKGYPFFNNKDKKCSRDCANYKTSTTDPIINKNNETCFENPEDCPEPYSSYYNITKMCYRTCPNYYYGKQCLDSCGDKYHFKDSKECLDNCSKTNFEPSNNTEKICYEKCPDEEPYIKMRVFGDTGSFMCVSECPIETPFYYEDTKQCAINCGSDLYKSNNGSEKICVKSCPKGEKIFNNYCVKDCSEVEGAPFTALLEFSNKNQEKVEKCVSSCLPSYPLALNSTKKCVNECPVSESVIYKSFCYAKCPNNTFYDPLNNTCLDSEEESKCPKGLNYFVKNGDYYECKMSCPKKKFHPENGGECLERCESGQKIGGNNFCLSQCNETTGEYYITIDNVYNISQCVASCGENFTVYDTNECVSKCPPGYYESTINKKCYNICNIDPDYPFSTKNDSGHLICGKKCNGEAVHYNSNLICSNTCSSLIQNITDYDKACVSKCNNQSIYKYVENWTCVKECSQDYYIIEKELKCVNKCSAPYNYIVGKECRDKCDENHFKRLIKDENGNNIYECVEKCESNEYYYETGPNKKICLSECQKGQYQEDFIIEDTNICISTCNSSYYFYFYDGTNISKYINNTCVKQCPKDKPFYDDNKNCLKSCRKFSMINEHKCIDKCPKGTIEVDSICTSTCPSNKFNESNTCKDKCSGDNPCYVPGINYCLPDCDRGSYRKDGYKCVTSCNESSYYINETNTCVSNCENGSYYIEYYPFEGFTSNSCFKDCPEDFPFYSDEFLIQNDINVSLHVCKRDCKFAEKSNESSSNSFKCLDNEEFCPEPNSYYDPETKLCDSKCPKDKIYYINKTGGTEGKKYYECHDKCPKNTYINQTDDKGIECVKECGEKYLDYEGTNKSCVSSCENKKEFIDDGGIKYCLSNCSDLGLFTDNKKCVKECDHGKHLIENMLTKTCDCENLFYVNESENICLESSKKCSDISTVDSYYRKYKEYECVKNCTGIISVDGDLCYLSESQCPINSQVNNNKCECSYKYYKDKNNQTICLGEKVECPTFYPYLKNNKECVEECDSGDIKFDYKCLNIDDFVGYDYNPLNCTKKVEYFNGTKYICSDNELNCSSQYKIEKLNLCVETCDNPEYFIHDSLNGKKNCVPTCNNSYSSIKSYINENRSESYECACKYKWYKVGDKIICSENKNITCTELTKSLYNFTNKSSNECIQQCNNYIFNNECFNNCEDVQKFYGINVILDGNQKCKCKNLWKTIKIEGKDDKIECIEDLYCPLEGFKFLINETKECVSDCISPFPFKFNYECYKNSCPKNANPKSNNTCECSYYYFKYKDAIYKEDFINCLPSEECPLDYPYLKVNECLNDSSSCIKEFNYKCFDTCPENTKDSEGNKKCECDKKNPWRRYSKNNKEYFDCKVINCTKIDNTTNECVNVCKEAQYIFNNNCYDRCPPNTRTADQTSKECLEIVAFDEAENLSDLNDQIELKIKEIYPTSSDGGIIYNMNNSTLQIYGVNKNKKENSELIMRSNLTYIDLSYCYDKLYGNGDLQEGDDIIIVKYDIGDKTNSLTINPVEFEAFNSRTGDKIDLSVCDNSIVISYPITNILNNYAAESNKLRNLEEKINNLNLKEKFLKGKELYLDDKDIDSFNFKNKLYTDICCPCEINGKDLILEDRFNYLYPLFSSFCESNCIYGRTDFIAERVICNCSPKSEIDFDRELTLQTNEASVKNAKDDQKGSILKCISKVSNIAKNFGFFYGLIILLVEIGMVILTILYSYKVFIMRVKKKFDISGNENNNIDTENIENINLREDNKYNNKKTNENIKTSERNLEYPPKKTNKTNTNANKTNKRRERKEETAKTNKQNTKDPEVININKLKIKENNYVENEEKMSYNSQSNDYYEKSSVQTMKEMEDESLFDLIKNEEKLLTVDYNYAFRKNKAEIVVMVLTEVMDKIYLIKAIWFLQKYEIFSLYFSLYLLWHLLIISFLSLFYNNSALHKIWIRDDYPDLNYHLGFGFVACIISFVFYRGLLFLINNDKKIKEIETINKENKREIGEKYDKMIFWAKIKMIIFYAVVFLLVIIFFLYLTAFCGVYTGTSSNLIESYGITLIEVIIIKVLYGIVLGILRKISLSFEINILYTIVRYLDLYIS